MLDFEAYFKLVKGDGALSRCPADALYLCRVCLWRPAGLALRYPSMRLRVNHPLFLEKVSHFYDWLFPKLLPYQKLVQGGPIWVENEYGSYAEDKACK